MAGTERGEAARRSEPQKAGPSTDCTLQPECMKLESLVIAHQHGAVNTFPGLVHTARHTIRVGGGRSRQFLERKANAGDDLTVLRRHDRTLSGGGRTHQYEGRPRELPLLPFPLAHHVLEGRRGHSSAG